MKNPRYNKYTEKTGTADEFITVSVEDKRFKDKQSRRKALVVYDGYIDQDLSLKGQVIIIKEFIREYNITEITEAEAFLEIL